MPFAIRNGFGSETSLTNIYNVGFPSTAPGGGVFPYNYNPANPKFYPSQSIEAIGLNFKDSSVYQYNLSVQRQLPYKINATAAYVGTLGRHLSTFIDANYAPYSTVTLPAVRWLAHSPLQRQASNSVGNSMPASTLRLAP